MKNKKQNNEPGLSIINRISRLILENSRGYNVPKTIRVSPHVFEQIVFEMGELPLVMRENTFINGDLYYSGCKIVISEQRNESIEFDY